MRKRFFPLALGLPILLLLVYVFSDKLILAVRVAQLYGKAPDQRLEMPVQGMTRSQVRDTWHAPRDGDRLHQGQDIFAPQGTPVLSSTRGYVMRVGNNKLGGKTVWVIGTGGRLYYYAHLDAYAPDIETGDYVTAQSVLGFVGTTGNAAGTPPHLHFGVYTREGAVNPLPMLIDRPEGKLEPKKSVKPTRKKHR